MLIVLFIFEIVIVGLTILTTHMVEHKFKMIKMSLSMYANKRTYKTKTHLDFIESILNMYHKIILDTSEEPDLESAIKRKLQQESIGKFSYISVKNMAIKTRHLMWAILGLELIIAWVNQELYSRQNMILMGGSLLITVVMAFYGLIKGVDEKGEALIDEVIHYVRNVYPLERSHKMSVVVPKQGTAISLEEHKAKREEAKVSEKQIIRDQAYELRNYEMKKVSLHKENNMKPDKILSETVKQETNEEEYKNSGKALENEALINKVIYQELSIQELEGQVNEEDAIELSAKDIAQLLNHL